MIYGCRFSENTKLWNSNSLDNKKYKHGSCIKKIDLTRIPYHDPMLTSPLCYHTANAHCDESVLIYYIFLLYYIKVKKVKLSRYTPWRRMGEKRYSSYTYLTSATRWG
jgi:hypothetical protein